jgi:hypothetical protein
MSFMAGALAGATRAAANRAQRRHLRADACVLRATGGLATLVTHPPDVMRTRLQLRRATLMANGGQLVRGC